MKKSILLIVFLLTIAKGPYAQSFSAEVMTGNQNYWYQHAVGVSLANSPFEIFHASSMHWMYEEREKNEIMSQSYITYPLTSSIRLAAGTFYASKPGISPSLAIQFRFAHRHLRGVIVPRADVKNNGSIEAMTSVEYLPPINEQLTFYARAQLMSNYGPYNHNRSYQNFRVGVRTQKTTFGFALNVDERGAEKQTMHNWGVFLRYNY